MTERDSSFSEDDTDESSADPSNTPKQLSLPVAELQRFAFDEMNIIETPFALLSKDTSRHRTLPLSEDSTIRLVCTDPKLNLPNSLAPRIVLGLMWYSKHRTGLTTPVIQFELRELVCKYVFPERFSSNYTPNSVLMKAVEHQINCVAGTRMITDAWWDQELRKHTEMNAAIIDYVQVVERGGKNRPRVLRLRWGDRFWKSMVDGYTKEIDVRLLQRIEKPLDYQMYRLLSRQLHSKRSQSYTNIIVFARRKLGMTGQKIDAGGRTASSYIAKRLRESLERLRYEGFGVRLTVNSSTDVFSIRFDRIDSGLANEIIEEDQPGDLVRHFRRLAHGVSLDAKASRISAADRECAEQWIEKYGYKQSEWMVRRSVEIQKERNADRILRFVGLQLYEDAAIGDYQQDVIGQRAFSLKSEDDSARERRKVQWEAYQTGLIQRAEQEFSDEDRQLLRAEAERRAAEFKLPGVSTVLEPLVQSYFKTIVLERMDAISQEEFQAFEKDDDLRDVLVARHGDNPIDDEQWEQRST